MKYLDMRKTYGILNNSSLIYPKVIKEEDFIFPKQSILIWLDYTIKFHPHTHQGLLFHANKPDMFISDTLVNPIGKVKRNSVNPNSLRSTYKKDDKGAKFISITRSMMTSPSKLLVNNVSLINELHRYGSSSTTIYDKAINKLMVALSSINEMNLGVGRQRYLTIEVPEQLPNYKETIKWMTLSPKVLTAKIEDARVFVILELFKFLDAKLTGKSRFSIIKKLELVEFIFTYRGKFILINGQDFRAILNDKKQISKLSGYTGSKPKKIFNLLLLRLMVEEPIITTNLSTKIESTKEVAGFTGSDEDIDNLIENLEKDKPVHDIYVEEDELIEVEAPTMEELLTSKPKSVEDINASLTLAYNKGELTKAQYEKQLKRLVDQGDILAKLIPDPTEKELDGTEVIPSSKLTPDETILSDKVGAIRRTYVAKSHEKNLQRVIYGIQTSGHIVTKVEIEDRVSLLEGNTTYKVTIATADKVPVTLPIIIPKLRPDGTFKNTGNEYIMRPQRTDVPIKKKSPTQVLLNSHAGKLTIERDKYSKNNISKSYLKQLINNPNIKGIIEGDGFANEEDLPYLYTTLSKGVKSFRLGKDRLSFTYKLRNKYVNKNDKLVAVEKHGLLIGKRGNKYLLLKDDTVYIYDGKTSTSIGTLETYLEIDMRKIVPQVATVNIFSTTLPLALVLMHKCTFSQLLRITKVKYRKVPYKNGIKVEPNEYKLVLSDYVFIFDKNEKQNTLLFAGLADIKDLKGMALKNMDNLHGLANVGNLLNIDRSIIVEIKNLFNLFLDPMTIITLTSMKEPTCLEGLFFRATELLLTDYAPDATDLKYQQIVGEARIAGAVYKQLTTGIKNYETKKSTSRARISVNPYETLQMVVSDSSTVLVDDLNPIAYLKQTEDITYVGFGGRNKDTLTRESRTVHVNDIGVISEAGKDSTDVGISAYLSADPKLDGTTGLLLDDGKPLTKANVFSPTTLLFPYNDLDDPKRTNFTSIQSGHTTALNSQMVLPVRSQYSSVLGHRMPDKFVVTADSKGRVTFADKHKIKIKYDNGGTETYALKTWFTKAIGNTTYKHKIVTTLVKGSKFKQGDVITFDQKFFGIDMFDRTKVIYKNGVVLRTVYIEDSDTYEDSITLSNTVIKHLSVDTTKIRSIVIDNTYNINKVKDIGDRVSTLDPLLIMTNVIGDEVELGKSLEVSDDTLHVLSDINDNAPKAKYSGEIVRRVVYYNSELKDMSPGLKKLAKESDTFLKEESGEDINGQVLSGYRIKGKPLEPGSIEVQFYIEEEAIAGSGDKFVFANQLKGTVSTVFENMFTASGRVAEAEFSTISESARIVNSSDIVSVKTTILRETSLRAGTME